MEQLTGSKLGKEKDKAVYCHSAYLTICRVHHAKCQARTNHKLKSRLLGKNINNLRYADDTTLMAESEEELKNLLMRVKEKSEKVGLKLSIKKTKIMASSPITSHQIDGEKDQQSS